MSFNPKSTLGARSQFGFLWRSRSGFNLKVPYERFQQSRFKKSLCGRSLFLLPFGKPPSQVCWNQASSANKFISIWLSLVDMRVVFGEKNYISITYRFGYQRTSFWDMACVGLLFAYSLDSIRNSSDFLWPSKLTFPILPHPFDLESWQLPSSPRPCKLRGGGPMWTAVLRQASCMVLSEPLRKTTRNIRTANHENPPDGRCLPSLHLETPWTWRPESHCQHSRHGVWNSLHSPVFSFGFHGNTSY